MKSLTRPPIVKTPIIAKPNIDIYQLLYSTKRCLKCNRDKRLSLFPPDKKLADGKGSTCQACLQPRAKPRRDNKKTRTKVCACCERKREKSQFTKMEWREDGHDSTCKLCRPTLRLEKGISRWTHDYELTPEEIVAIRLLGESRSDAREMCVRHALEYIWFIDHMEHWKCEESGRPLAVRRRGGRKPAFEPMIKLKDPRRGFIPSNSYIAARIP